MTVLGSLKMMAGISFLKQSKTTRSRRMNGAASARVACGGDGG